MRQARVIRENKRISIKEVHDRTGIDTASLSRFERGEGRLLQRNLERYAQFLQVTVDDLLREVEVGIGNKLPVSQRRPPSRTTEPTGGWEKSPQTMKTRGEPDMQPVGTAHPSDPLFGALKGTVYIPPGVDLTGPADPEWGKLWDEHRDD